MDRRSPPRSSPGCSPLKTGEDGQVHGCLGRSDQSQQGQTGGAQSASSSVGVGAERVSRATHRRTSERSPSDPPAPTRNHHAHDHTNNHSNTTPQHQYQRPSADRMAVLASASSASTSTTPATTRSISGTVGGSSSGTFVLFLVIEEK
ncbi:hypothetical protein WR25_16737 isoform C [Diploscapter pachys]|uniref:Uncharacterized protein n=1 Tax=Diploscapter pachys TaxID=2018661 RepID=A0A2A2JL29_9BILA|nr:hypothetical protein WR25_16737 isoform A [Diploscapter pachys]PAV62349.1 hypothetical protein WR25_16737 isoform C [Diploscapter pachys]